MKKLIVKDINLRNELFLKTKKYFVLSVIANNSNFINFVRWNARKKLEDLTKTKSISALSNRCQKTINKKRLNKLTYYSRHVFLKQIRFGEIHGLRKACW